MQKLSTNTVIGAALAFAIAMPCAALGFSDVNSKTNEGEAIIYMQANLIINGYDDGTFRPNAPINRVEFLKIVWNNKYAASDPGCKFAKMPGSDAPMAPSDVQVGAWYAPYLCMFLKVGVVSGYPDGTFRPEKPISLPEAAKILFVLEHLEDAEAQSKARSAALWYEPYVRFLSDEAAIPTGVPDLTQPLTRGQVADILFRILFETDHWPHWTYENLRSGRFVESASSASAKRSSSANSRMSISAECLASVPKPVENPGNYAITPFADYIANEDYQSALEACEKRRQKSSASASSRKSIGSSSSTSLDGWSTYQSYDHRFSIKYPPDWKVSEYPQSSMIGLGPKTMHDDSVCFVSIESAHDTTIEEMYGRIGSQFGSDRRQTLGGYPLDSQVSATRITTTTKSLPDWKNVTIYVAFEDRIYAMTCDDSFDGMNMDTIYRSFRVQ